MTRMTMLLCAWLCAILPVAVANPAQAGFFSYVSNTGNDSNNCSTPATACASFAHALTQTAANGEIDCLNAGNYGQPNIAQSVTIDCAGNVGVSDGNIIINGAGIVVRLRNLTFNGVGFIDYAVDVKNVAALYVENCIITGFNNDSGINGPPPFIGIKFEPSANAQLVVTNTIVSNNGNVAGGSGGGISIAPTSGATASVTLDGVKLNGNVYGIGMNSTGGVVVGTLRHSVISGSNVSGLVAFGGGSPIFWTVDDSTIMNNPSFGIQTLGSGVNLQISRSTISGNGTGVSGPGIVSFKDNRINGNATDGTPLPAVSSGLQ
jgi:hypothetical protein